MTSKAKTSKRAAARENLPADLVKLANRLAGLQRRRRDEMRKIREINGLIRQTRRELKALAGSLARPDPFDQLPATRFEQ
jgi:hypothetical protein